jgi:hypothetical protein
MRNYMRLEEEMMMLREARASRERVLVDRADAALYAKMFAGTETGELATATVARCDRVLASIDAVISSLT